MARIAAGKRDRKIAFYPQIVTTEGLGTEVEADGTPVFAWAYVRFGNGAERREAGQAGSALTATFRVASTTSLRTVTERWQIEFLGARWGIQSIAPAGIAEDIEFTATRRGA
jgi:head-tail adaptor